MTARASARRRYDNSGREQQAAATRASIVDAGAELLHGSSIRDWRRLTVRGVAERAGVHERTVYRHFGNEKALRDAVMERLEHDAGVDLSDVGVDDLAEVAARVLRYASAYPSEPRPELEPTLADADARRRAALQRAVRERAGQWRDDEQVRVAAIIDVLWSLTAYERLLVGWGFDRDAAISAIRWAIGLVEDAVRAGPPPAAPSTAT